MKIETEVPSINLQTPVNFDVAPTTLAPPSGNFSFELAVSCPSINFKAACVILMKVCTKGYDEVPQTTANFATVLTTLAPPSGHFDFPIATCLSVIYLQNRLWDLDEI